MWTEDLVNVIIDTFARWIDKQFRSIRFNYGQRTRNIYLQKSWHITGPLPRGIKRQITNNCYVCSTLFRVLSELLKGVGGGVIGQLPDCTGGHRRMAKELIEKSELVSSAARAIEELAESLE